MQDIKAYLAHICLFQAPLHTVQRICAASSKSGWRGCNKPSALQQAALCTRLLNKIKHTDNQDGQKAPRQTLPQRQKARDYPSLPPFSIVRFLSQGRDEFFYVYGCFLKMCVFFWYFYLFDLLFKASLCTNFGRRSRGVSLELSEYSWEKSETAALYFSSLPVHVQMHRDIFPSRFSTPGEPCTSVRLTHDAGTQRNKLNNFL